MGLFKKEREVDDADDWLADLQLDDDETDSVILDDDEVIEPVAHFVNQSGFDPADLLPPVPDDAGGGWYLPDLVADAPPPPSDPEGFALDDVSFDSPSVDEPWPMHQQPVDATAAMAIGSHERELAPADGPSGPEASLYLEILGLAEGATWDEVKTVHAEFLVSLGVDSRQEPEQADLAEEIRREMNTAYAALRVQAVG